MKRMFLGVALILACGLVVLGQQTAAGTQGSSETTAAANGAGKSANIQSGTHLSGQLQNTLDARKARVGDEVVLKTTEAIKSQGHVVVNKGARLIGNVTSVAQKTGSHKESQIGILFNRLESGSLAMPISATISSITQAHAQAQGNDDMIASDMGATSSSSTSARRAPATSGGGGSGGLLGGVTSTVGGVTNTATSTVGGATGAVGGTLNSTTNAAGQTTGGLGRSLGGIQITESSSTSAQGSSMLTLQGDNLHLEKGTTFNLVVNQSASAGASKNQ